MRDNDKERERFDVSLALCRLRSLDGQNTALQKQNNEGAEGVARIWRANYHAAAPVADPPLLQRMRAVATCDRQGRLPTSTPADLGAIIFFLPALLPRERYNASRAHPLSSQASDLADPTSARRARTPHITRLFSRSFFRGPLEAG